MSNKYIRHQPAISRQSSAEQDENHWLNQFQQKLAVQPRRVDHSLFEQINSIMNGKSKHTSVEAAVNDMKERSGLTAYLDKIKESTEQEDVRVKKASEDNNQVIDKKISLAPIVITKCPAIGKTIENYIQDTKGNLSVPAIIEKIKSIHSKDVADAKDWDDENLIRHVSKLNLSAKSENPINYQDYQNLGTRDILDASENDPANKDVFYILNPAK